MKSRIALKKLTLSDLTLFKEIFDREDSNSKQKSINLNANPFTTSFYPNLDELSVEYDRRFGVDLRIYGPDFSYPVHVLQRKIVKSEKGKNWRLNGEFVPLFEETDRYSILSKDDLAVIEFFGINKPERIKLLLVSRLLQPQAHQFLSDKFSDASSRQTMIEINGDEITNWNLLENFDLPKDFILSERFIADDFLSGEIENTEGDISFTNKYMSTSDLKEGQREAEKIGEKGELFVNQYLQKKIGRDSFVWSSLENPISPFDFKIVKGDNFFLDVKSTRGAFGQPFYMSLNEIRAAATLDEYRIYRVYNLTDATCLLSISSPIKNFCIEILEVIKEFSLGVKPTAMSIRPSTLKWEDIVSIELEEEE